MIQGNDLDLREAIWAGARHGLTVTLLNPHSPLRTVTLPITKWSETVTDDGDLRHFSFGVPLVVDGEDMWPGADTSHPLYPAGQQAAITWNVTAGLATWALPMGTYDLVNVSRDDTTVAIEAYSPLHSLALVQQLSPYTTRASESLIALARRIAGTGVVLSGVSNSTPNSGLVLDVAARKSLQAVIDAFPARARYGADGLVLVPPADPGASPVVEYPAATGLVFGGDALSRDDIVTRVLATGEGTGGSGVGIAEELDGPTGARFVGYQSATYGSPLLTTNAAAKAAATTRLRNLRNASRTQEVIIALDPRLEVFDVVKITQAGTEGRRGGSMVGQVVGIERSFPGATMKVQVQVYSSEVV